MIDIPAIEIGEHETRTPEQVFAARKHPHAICEILLTNGGVALVDERDFATLSAFTWHRSDNGYARRSSTYRERFMHRLIMNASPTQQVEHEDRNRLNNVRGNLRFSTQQQNSRNASKRKGKTSKYKGVYRHTYNHKWIAQICVDGKSINLGSFDLEDDAARAYDIAALEHFGSFVVLNFSESNND